MIANVLLSIVSKELSGLYAALLRGGGEYASYGMLATKSQNRRDGYNHIFHLILVFGNIFDILFFIIGIFFLSLYASFCLVIMQFCQIFLWSRRYFQILLSRLSSNEVKVKVAEMRVKHDGME